VRGSKALLGLGKKTNNFTLNSIQGSLGIFSDQSLPQQ
jgi:hypothetical protein